MIKSLWRYVKKYDGVPQDTPEGTFEAQHEANIYIFGTNGDISTCKMIFDEDFNGFKSMFESYVRGNPGGDNISIGAMPRIVFVDGDKGAVQLLNVWNTKPSGQLPPGYNNEIVVAAAVAHTTDGRIKFVDTDLVFNLPFVITAMKADKVRTEKLEMGRVWYTLEGKKLRECAVCGLKTRADGSKEARTTPMDLQQCANCKSVHYCCAAHQKHDWDVHKLVCKKV